MLKGKPEWSIMNAMYIGNIFYGLVLYRNETSEYLVVSKSTAEIMVEKNLLHDYTNNLILGRYHIQEISGYSAPEDAGLHYIKVSYPHLFEEEDEGLCDINSPFDFNLWISGKNVNRPSWDEFFMFMAQWTSSRATCNRLKVGAVLVKDKHIVAQGYNGSGEGEPHCTDVGCLMHEGSCKRTRHAEKNIILMCSKFGIATEGTTLYVTHYPCPDCMQDIKGAGIKEVVYREFYKHKFENNFDKNLILRQFK